MSSHSVRLWECVFSNIPSLPPLLEVGQRDISFIHKKASELHPIPLCQRLQFLPACGTAAPLLAKPTRCSPANAVAPGDKAMTSPTNLMRLFF